jgi:hypothetical protein
MRPAMTQRPASGGSRAGYERRTRPSARKPRRCGTAPGSSGLSCPRSGWTSSSDPRRSPSGTASPHAGTAPPAASPTPEPIRRVTNGQIAHCVGGVLSPLLSNIFLTDLRERFAKFSLELHPGKTRLIEFGRHAARARAARGLGKPETFAFLGFTHICGKGRSGQFWLRRITIAKRMRAKLAAVYDQLKRRRHLPIPEQGRWLASVLRGHLAYYAVPGNSRAVQAFRSQVTRYWLKALRRRSQRHRLNWERMDRLARRWLPPAHILHPYPEARFHARTRGRSPVR